MNLNKKELLKLQKYFCSARKYGYTCIALCQSYTDTPIQMRKNMGIFMLFKMNDMNSINQLIWNHNTDGIKRETILNMYHYATKEPKCFFTIDFNSDEYMFRKNFTEILNPDEFK